MRQCCSGAMDQRGTQMLVAPLGDTEQPLLAAGRMLPRCQAQPCSQIAAPSEPSSVTHCRNQTSRVHRSDPRDLAQSPTGLVLLGQAHELGVVGPDPLVQLTPFYPQVLDQSANAWRQAIALFGEDARQRLLQHISALGNYNLPFQ